MIFLLLWVVITLGATLTGPFGSYEGMIFRDRLLFWAFIVAISIVGGRAAHYLAHTLLFPERGWVADGAYAVFAVLILLPILTFVAPLMPSVSAQDLPPPAVLGTFIAVVAAIIIFIKRAVLGSDDLPETPSLRPRLADRLPQGDWGEILRLESRDHIVDVVTEGGVVPIRMRLADAMREMDPVEGFCAHRSHWVCRTAITGIEKEGSQRAWLLIRNGDRVPVSRKYRVKLESAGLL